MQATCKQCIDHAFALVDSRSSTASCAPCHDYKLVYIDPMMMGKRCRVYKK